MKLLGVVFAFVLLLLPLSVNLKATNDAEDMSSTTLEIVEEGGKEAKGFMSSFMKIIKNRIEKIESSEIKTEYSEAKSRLENFQKKVEDLLKKLNNTE